jgi:hypothetical protein
MSYKTVCVLIMLLLTIYTKLYADTLRVEDFDQNIDVKMVEMNEEYVKVVVPKKAIRSISVKSKLDDEYPDTVFINVNGKENIVICKIVKITKKPGSITLKIPRVKVSVIQIDFPNDEYDIDYKRKDSLSSPMVEKSYSPIDADSLKKQIKEELIDEFEEKQKRDEVSIEEKIHDNLTLEFEKKQKLKEEKYDSENYGKVSGCMLIRGKQLKGCQVKITLLEKWALFGKPKEGIKFETITDKDGHYSFEKIPPGGYKLYWKPPNETSWIRSIKMEPDFFVETGETYSAPDRETNIRTIN